MHQHRCITLVRSVGHQQFDNRFVSPIHILECDFVHVQPDRSDTIRMGKREILRIGGHFSVEFQIQRCRRGIAVHPHFLVEASDSFSIEYSRYLTGSSGRDRVLCPLRLGTPAGGGHIRNDQRLVAGIGKLEGNGCGILPQHIP